jgi:transposase
MKAYIDGARAGAPQATQVADRFHLLQNLAEALDQVFSAHGSVLKAVREAISAEPVTGREGTVAVPVAPTAPTAIEEARAKQRRARRWANYERVWVLHRQGWSNRAIAKQLGIGRMTVVRYLQAATFPERKGRRDKGKSLLNPYKEHLLKHWNADCRDARRLFHEIQCKGYMGSYATVARYASRLRQAQGLRSRERRPGERLPTVTEPRQRPLTTRRATSLVLQRSEKRQPEDEQLITRIKAQHPELSAAIEFARDFAEIVRQRQPDRLDGWLSQAMDSTIAALRRFAKGLRDDYDAVKAGITLPWSNGPVEGHINRLKMLKRQMYGRAGIDLLSRRFLLAA